MFHSFKDTNQKLDYLESSKPGREEPINISWLIRTLRETNEMAERYEKALKEIAENNEDSSCNELALKYEVVAEKVLEK